MVKNIVNSDKLSDHVRRVVLPYAQQMIKIYGQNLMSIIVYGSAITEDFVPKRSNINLLIILQQITLQDLKRGSKLVISGQIKKGIIPLFLTQLHIQTSSDVFPIEFLEMKENHLLLFGEDILKEIDISPVNIRLQCEEALKGKLIRLQQAYLELGTKLRRLEGLMIESLTSFMPIFRNILRLKQRDLPGGKQGIIEMVGTEFGVDKKPLLRILEAKKGKRMAKTEIEPIFGDYLEQVRGLVVEVDQLKV